jgi:hypothetical protein
MPRILLCSTLILLPFGLLSQNRHTAQQPSRHYRLDYRAPDSSISAVRKGHPSSLKGALRITPGPGQFTVGFVIDDAAECAGPVSVEHHVNADTITVTIFYSALAICPGVVTLREYLLTVSGLKAHRYALRIYLGDIGGPGGKTSSATPWLIASVSPL